MGQNSQKAIYIVDDDASVGKSLSRLLQTFGFHVVAFTSAHEFLSSLITDAPRCLILDIHMPDMDGFELQQQLKNNGKNLPVIFITAYAQEGDRERALNAGAVGFLTKPFLEENLLDLINVALKGNVP